MKDWFLFVGVGVVLIVIHLLLLSWQRRDCESRRGHFGQGVVGGEIVSICIEKDAR